jgi:hypothetical protein
MIYNCMEKDPYLLTARFVPAPSTGQVYTDYQGQANPHGLGDTQRLQTGGSVDIIY